MNKELFKLLLKKNTELIGYVSNDVIEQLANYIQNCLTKIINYR